MSYALLSAILADRKVADDEVPRIREYLYQDGGLNLDDVKLLVELYCEALEHGPAFEDLLFEVLEQVILADGEIQPSEQFYLLKMLCSGRKLGDRERALLGKVRKVAKNTSPEFEDLCREVLQANDRS